MTNNKQIKLPGLSISYPCLAFAFNPIPIVCELNKDMALLTISSRLQLERTLQRGRNIIDIQALARALFSSNAIPYIQTDDHTLFQKMRCSIRLDDKVCEIEIPILWGALQIGEQYNRCRQLYYFPNYPFSISVYSEEQSLLSLTSQQTNLSLGEIPAFSKRNIAISPYADTLQKSKRWHITSKDIRYYNVFDQTFDSIFQPQKVFFASDLSICIEVETCQRGGVYLRWVNKYAEYCYYLFDLVSSKIEVKDDETSFQESLDTVAYIDAYQSGISRSIGKESKEYIALNVAWIDSKVQAFLRTMLESPQVDRWMGYDKSGRALWQAVSIVEGSFGYSSASLQDFDCTIALAPIISQKL